MKYFVFTGIILAVILTISFAPTELITAMGGIIPLLLFLILYFLPAAISQRRKHKGATQVFILNLLTGWTIVGWFISLIWAFSSDIEKEGLTKLPPQEQKDKLIADMAGIIERLEQKLNKAE